MKNAKVKHGFFEQQKGVYTDDIPQRTYVWHEAQWKHDDYEHQHTHYQLTYVQEGYQYFHVENKIYLVPQNHVIWIPTQLKHKATSESASVILMAILFKVIPDRPFYNALRIFPAAPVLKEMILYASKWSKLINDDEEQDIFLMAMINSLPNFYKEGDLLQVPVPTDERLLKVCNYINTHYQLDLDFGILPDLAGMSMRSLQRIFKAETELR